MTLSNGFYGPSKYFFSPTKTNAIVLFRGNFAQTCERCAPFGSTVNYILHNVPFLCYTTIAATVCLEWILLRLQHVKKDKVYFKKNIKKKLKVANVRQQDSLMESAVCLTVFSTQVCLITFIIKVIIVVRVTTLNGIMLPGYKASLLTLRNTLNNKRLLLNQATGCTC